MLLEGTLVAIQKDISEHLHKSLQVRFNEAGGNQGELLKPKKLFVTTELEPGVIAPGIQEVNVPAEASKDPGVLETKDPSTEQIEPGMTAPKGKVDKRPKDGTAEKPSKKKRSAKTKEKVSAAKPTEKSSEASESSGQMEWKNNKDYAQQKAEILSSKDTGFLQAVAADAGETKQFQKLAKARINELST